MPHLVYFLLNAMPFKKQSVQKFFFLLCSQRKSFFPLPCENQACQVRHPKPSRGWERIIVEPDTDITCRAPCISHGVQCCGQSRDKGVKRNPKKYDGKAFPKDGALSAWQPFFPLHPCRAIRVMGEALTAWAALCGLGSGGQEGPHFLINRREQMGREAPRDWAELQTARWCWNGPGGKKLGVSRNAQIPGGNLENKGKLTQAKPTKMSEKESKGGEGITKHQMKCVEEIAKAAQMLAHDTKQDLWWSRDWGLG